MVLVVSIVIVMCLPLCGLMSVIAGVIFGDVMMDTRHCSLSPLGVGMCICIVSLCSLCLSLKWFGVSLSCFALSVTFIALLC